MAYEDLVKQRDEAQAEAAKRTPEYRALQEELRDLDRRRFLVAKQMETIRAGRRAPFVELRDRAVRVLSPWQGWRRYQASSCKAAVFLRVGGSDRVTLELDIDLYRTRLKRTYETPRLADGGRPDVYLSWADLQLALDGFILEGPHYDPVEYLARSAT